MATAYTRLAEIRDRAVKVRDSLPIGSVEGALYTELVDALEAAILEVTTATPDKTDDPQQDMMPQGFGLALFIRDCFDTNNQMAVVS